MRHLNLETPIRSNGNSPVVAKLLVRTSWSTALMEVRVECSRTLFLTPIARLGKESIIFSSPIVGFGTISGLSELALVGEVNMVTIRRRTGSVTWLLHEWKIK